MNTLWDGNLNCFGAEETELSANDIRDIVKAFATIPVMGERYPAHLQKTVDK